MRFALIPLSLVLTASGLLLSATATPRAAAPAVQRSVARCSGRVVGWRIESDGKIFVEVERGRELSDDSLQLGERLEGEKVRVLDDDSPRVWFRTPANQTTTTRFEDLLLQVMLGARDAKSSGGLQLTFLGEADTDADGGSWKTAYTILSVSNP